MRFFRSALVLAAAILFGSNVAHANITYTCDPNVASQTCNTLNTTIAGLYNSTFTNADANIYIQYGTTGLGESTTGFFNTISYANYRADLIAEAGSGLVRADAIASLPVTEPALYSGGAISITSAQGTALGLTGLNGTTAGGALCTVGTSGCYNGIITITSDPGTPLYYRTGGTEPADAYDYFSVVEHETDEVLGTSSCIGTTGGSLSNGCTGAGASASAVDLFRCGPSNTHVLLDGTPGAYFSYNGCGSNGAVGAGGSPDLYNTLANGDDYADFISSSPNCATNLSIQDGTGCPGTSGLDITNDGGAEINILDAIGYNLATNSNPAPEPMTLAIMLPGIAGLAALRRRRKAKTAA